MAEMKRLVHQFMKQAKHASAKIGIGEDEPDFDDDFEEDEFDEELGEDEFKEKDTEIPPEPPAAPPAKPPMEKAVPPPALGAAAPSPPAGAAPKPTPPPKQAVEPAPPGEPPATPPVKQPAQKPTPAEKPPAEPEPAPEKPSPPPSSHEHIDNVQLEIENVAHKLDIISTQLQTLDSREALARAEEQRYLQQLSMIIEKLDHLEKEHSEIERLVKGTA